MSFDPWQHGYHRDGETSPTMPIVPADQLGSMLSSSAYTTSTIGESRIRAIVREELRREFDYRDEVARMWSDYHRLTASWRGKR